MVDMLVRLFALPEVSQLVRDLRLEGIIIRRPHPAESDQIVSWVEMRFSTRWAGECRGALEHRPVSCFIATEVQSIPNPSEDPYNLPPEKLIGFACYDIVAKGMFGPEGVHPDYRGRHIGKALLLSCLHAMADDGYGYAVIPWVGPSEFYAKTVGATMIADSEPGVFRGPLQHME
jgi:ribosomal protein S18 acetylase RimI-like enzyme